MSSEEIDRAIGHLRKTERGQKVLELLEPLIDQAARLDQAGSSCLGLILAARHDFAGTILDRLAEAVKKPLPVVLTGNPALPPARKKA